MKVEITFDEPIDVASPGLDGSTFKFPFVVRRSRDEASRDDISQHSVIVSISGTLQSIWGFARASAASYDLIKILFEFGRIHVERRIMTDQLGATERVDLRTDTAPRELPFDTTEIKDPTGSSFQIDIEEPMQSEPEAQISMSSVTGEMLRYHVEPPKEIVDSLQRFRHDHPDPTKTAFVMMQFGETTAHSKIMSAISDALSPYAITVLRADEKDYHDDLFANILTYVHGCTFGIAVFERIEADDFNPNVSLEVGYMLALRKPVCLLKDRTLTSLHTDLVGKLYKVFDPLDPQAAIPTVVKKWMADRGIINVEQNEQKATGHKFKCNYVGLSRDVQAFSREVFDFGATTRIVREYRDGTADIQFTYQGVYPRELFDLLANKHNLNVGLSPHEGV